MFQLYLNKAGGGEYQGIFKKSRNDKSFGSNINQGSPEKQNQQDMCVYICQKREIY